MPVSIQAQSYRSGMRWKSLASATCREAASRYFMVLGGAFLCVAGAEALYVDLGHFGPGLFRLSWGLVVFPALILPHVG